MRSLIRLRGIRGGLLLLAALALSGGCEPERPDEPGPTGADLPTGGDGGGDTGTSTSEPCEEGKTRACEVDLGTHNGVWSCFDGVQTCTGGEWGPCHDPDDTRLPPPQEDGPTAALPPKSSGQAA